MTAAADARRPLARLALIAALACATALAASSAAAAAAGSPRLPPSLKRSIAGHPPTPSPPAFFQPMISLGEQDGYTVEVYGESDKVYVVTSRNPWAFTIYAAPGKVTPTRIAAELGSFGRIAMRFRPSPERPWRKPNRRCKGKGRFVNRVGIFTGNARFRGERGYVSLRVRRAEGQVGAIAAKCLREAREKQRGRLARAAGARRARPNPTTIFAHWREGISSAAFGARAGRTRGTFFAEEASSRGRLAIFHVAVRRGSAKRLRVDGALTSLRVSPPAPFHGTGAYSAAPDGTVTWLGDLSVNFPGAPRTPLTGPRFKARLSAGF